MSTLREWIKRGCDCLRLVSLVKLVKLAGETRDESETCKLQA